MIQNCSSLEPQQAHFLSTVPDRTQVSARIYEAIRRKRVKPTETVLTGIIGDNNSRGILQIKIKGTEQALIQQNILFLFGSFPPGYTAILIHPALAVIKHPHRVLPCKTDIRRINGLTRTFPTLSKRRLILKIGISKYMIIVIGIVQIQYHRLVTLYTHTIGIPEQSRINGNNLPFRTSPFRTASSMIDSLDTCCCGVARYTPPTKRIKRIIVVCFSFDFYIYLSGTK